MWISMANERNMPDHVAVWWRQLNDWSFTRVCNTGLHRVGGHHWRSVRLIAQSALHLDRGANRPVLRWGTWSVHLLRSCDMASRRLTLLRLQLAATRRYFVHDALNAVQRRLA